MRAAYDADRWHDLFIMMGGAAAALIGLFFVVLVIRLEDVGPRWLKVGPRSSLAFLVVVLVASVIALVPDQPRAVTAAELGLTAVAGIVIYAVDIRYVISTSAGIPSRLLTYGPMRMGCLLAVVWGAVSIAIRHGGGWFVVTAALTGLLISSIQTTWWSMTGYRATPAMPERHGGDSAPPAPTTSSSTTTGDA